MVLEFLTLLAAGPDLKPPKDFKLMYQSLRQNGYKWRRRL